MIVEIVGEEFHFDEGFALGVEMAAGVAAEVFDLVIEAFGQVSGPDLRMDGSGVFEEGEVVGGAFFQVFDKGLVVGAEPLQEVAELGLGAFEAAGGLNFAPSVFEEGVVIWAEVALGITEEVDGTELVMGVGEQAGEQRGQAAEVIGDQEQDAKQAAIFEVDEDLAPGFQDLVAPEGSGGEDLFLAV